MSSAPPNPPPGYPPYDPKTQWRIYREQQKAAWRAQRDAARAQRYAWKTGYGYGPHVPSIVGPVILVAIGVIWLLIYSGHIAPGAFWGWYGHWWPALLIIAGLAMLGEWALDVRRATPVRRSGSIVGLLVVLAIVGMAVAGWSHLHGPWVHGPWNNGDNDFFNMFGLPQHDTDQAAIQVAIPANATIQIQNPRGDVSVTAGGATAIEVMAHQVAYASSDQDADKIFASEKAAVQVNGSSVLVQTSANDHGRVNLAITVPPSARVTIDAARGDVTVSGLNTGITLNGGHGDTQLSNINGSVIAHLSNNRHDFSAHQINGDLTIDGHCNDMTLSAIKGTVTMNGEIFGDVHMESLGGLRLHTSVTDLQLGALPGDMTLDSDTLRINASTGLTRVTTHAKDVDLNQIYGDSYVQDRDGAVSVEPAGAYAIDVRNSKGDIEVTLPPNASANVDGHVHNGDIVTDYGLAVSGDENKTVAGRIGAGAARIVLSTDNGDLGIKRGPAFPSTPPPMPENSGASTPLPLPPSPHARHLRPPPTPPPAPMAQ